jgi:hypothetical protein
MHRRLQEGRENACARKEFEAGGLDSGRAGLPMWDELAFDDARHDAIAGQFASREEAGRTGADNQYLLPLGVRPRHRRILPADPNTALLRRALSLFGWRRARGECALHLLIVSGHGDNVALIEALHQV